MKDTLQKVISVADMKEVRAALHTLWRSGDLVIQKAPSIGMIMCTIIDPFQTAFHLGEVLVTQAQVGCENEIGFGLVLGDEPEKALLLASVDAVLRCGNMKRLKTLMPLVERLKQKAEGQRLLDSQMASTTRVHFESMKKETIDFGSLGEKVI